MTPTPSAVTGLLMRLGSAGQVFALAGAALVALAGLAWVATPMRLVQEGPVAGP